jgi:hypothetical protein
MNIVPRAQTMRRGGAGPVSVLRHGWDSPAAFVFVNRRLLFCDRQLSADCSLIHLYPLQLLQGSDDGHETPPLRDQSSF